MPERIAGATSGAVIDNGGAQLAGAEDLRGLLIGRVDREQRRGRQQIDEREGVQHRDQHQAGHREHVEGEERQAEHVAHQHVDQAGVRAEQIDEGDGGEERRRKVGQRGGDLDQRLARHVGAAHRPGEREPDDQAEQAGPGAENERVLQRLHIEPAGQHLLEMLEAQAAFALHAAEQQREQRQHHEHDEREDRAAHDEVLEPQACPAPRDASHRWDDEFSGHLESGGFVLAFLGIVLALLALLAQRDNGIPHAKIAPES